MTTDTNVPPTAVEAEREFSIEDLQRAMSEAERKLDEVDIVSFSPAAVSMLKGKIEQFIVDLFDESIRIAKRRQADTVSWSHVKRASDNLVSLSRARAEDQLGTLGGTLLGAGVSAMVLLIIGGSATVSGIGTALVASLAGAGLIAYTLARE